MTTIPTGLADRLAVIELDLLAMVEMVAERVGLVTSAMLEGDVAAADRLVDADDDIDLLSLQVEEGCIAALVREQLLEVDLRFVVAAMHINMDVERGGNLVGNIAKAVGRLQGSRPDDQVRDLVARMSAQAQLLMRRAAESLRTRDSLLAESIDELDDVLDDLHYHYTQHVISDARRGDLDPQQSLQLALVGRFYEQIGDHAENVGERVRYIVDGWLPEIQAAERVRSRSGGPEPRPTRGLAVIDSIAESRRVDAIRRDFVANVSHELKTPVGAISLLAEALEGDQDVEDRERLTEMLRREVTRVGDIIDDLLELTRLEETETLFDVLDLDLIVHAAIEKVRSFADGHGVEISMVGLPAGLSVSGDRRQLVRALTNLLDNAVRYSDPEQLITVSVEAIEDGASITVKDDGVGIPRAELERVFERFYRVDRARSRDSGGTGLGLAIVRHVAQNHGGKVLVESKPGEGSRFSMHLPTAGTVSP